MDHPFPPHDLHSPSVMIERMEHMLVHASSPFTIKRLNGTSSRMESPTPLIRAVLHSFIFLTDGEALITLGDQTLLFRKGELTRRINSILAEDPLFNGASDGEEYVKELIIK